uniref:Cytochrome P450 n=1 Tax=Oryza brachyantha TaxID=4533 RepID=J3N430_ORYBR
MTTTDTPWQLLLFALVVPLVVVLARRGAGKKKGGARIPPGLLAVPVLGSLLWPRHSSADQLELLLRRVIKTSVFAFFPAVTKHLFRGRLQMGLALRRRQTELFLPLINARRARQNQIQQKDTSFEHSYVDTLFDVRLPDKGGNGFGAIKK